MADVKIEIQVNLEWGEMPTDLSNCFACGDLIVSNMFQVFFFINNVLDEKPSNLKVCKSCYQCLNTD